MNMMADAREPTLKDQARRRRSRTCNLEAPAPSARCSQRIARFRNARCTRRRATTCAPASSSSAGGPPALGPRALADGRTAVLGNNITNFVFPIGDAWREIAAQRRPRSRRAQRRARVDRARPRRVLLPHVLDQGRHAPEHGRARQSGEAHLRDLPWHAHDGHGYRERLDGHRHDEPAVGTETPQSPWAKEAPEMPLFKVTCDKSTSRRIRFSAA